MPLCARMAHRLFCSPAFCCRLSPWHAYLARQRERNHRQNAFLLCSKRHAQQNLRPKLRSLQWRNKMDFPPGIFSTDKIVPAGLLRANAWYIAMPEHRGSIRLGVIYEGKPDDHIIYCDVSSYVISGEDMLPKMQALLKLGESSSRKSHYNGSITLEWVVQPESAWRKFFLRFYPGGPMAGPLLGVATVLGSARRNVAQ